MSSGPNLSDCAVIEDGLVDDKEEGSGSSKVNGEQHVHRIVQLLDKALSGESSDPLSDFSSGLSSDDDEDDERTRGLSLPEVSRSAKKKKKSKNRRSSVSMSMSLMSNTSVRTRRRSSFGGDVFAEMIPESDDSSPTKMDQEQLAILLRKFYEQDRALRQYSDEELGLGFNYVCPDLPYDLKSMDIYQVMQTLVQLMDETEQLEDNMPDVAAQSHETDLNQMLTLIRNEYNSALNALKELQRKDQDGEKDEEARNGQNAEHSDQQRQQDRCAMIAAAERIRQKVVEIEELGSEVKDRMSQVRLLSQLQEK